MPGAGGHRVLVLGAGDSSALAGDTATTAGGCHRQHWEVWGAPSPARHPQNGSRPCRALSSPNGRRRLAGRPVGVTNPE